MSDDTNPIQALDTGQSRAELEQLLADHRQHLEALPGTAPAADRARVRLDIAEALLGLGRNAEAWDEARAVFDTFIDNELWQEAVEACDILYRCDQPESILALGNGTWLAVTYPIAPATSVAMLHHIVDETPERSDGGTVAAAAAHYIADLRTEEPDLEDVFLALTYRRESA